MEGDHGQLAAFLGVETNERTIARGSGNIANLGKLAGRLWDQRA
jgi:hypothetical protein